MYHFFCILDNILDTLQGVLPICSQRYQFDAKQYQSFSLKTEICAKSIFSIGDKSLSNRIVAGITA
jgi:hypothetical protein